MFTMNDQEADHWANIGAQGKKKRLVDRRGNSETWKAVTRFWDGSFKDKGRSGCGMVIKGVDGDSKIQVPLKVGTAMATEDMGVCVLTETIQIGDKQ